ncbi:hypothetical protein KC333_g9268 [Hortaea werneckii]|nr:hypothetical protein KC333_g9268 [Hortaea werneckii]KAI7300960.1 hypothetical protein KC326_g9246 [Hortaea werneckii]
MPPGNPTPGKTVTPEAFKRYKEALTAPTKRTYWNASFNKDRLIAAIKSRDHAPLPEDSEGDWEQFSPGQLQELLEMSDNLYDGEDLLMLTDPFSEDDRDADASIDSINKEPDAEDNEIDNLFTFDFNDAGQSAFGDVGGTRDGLGGGSEHASDTKASEASILRTRQYFPVSVIDIDKFFHDTSDSENEEIISLKKELQEEREAGERTRKQLRELLERERKDKKTKIEIELKKLKAELEAGQAEVQGLQDEYETYMKGVEKRKHRLQQKTSDLTSINGEIEAMERELTELQKPEGGEEGRRQKQEEAAADSEDHQKE